MKKMAPILALALLSAPALGAPFGIDQGTKITALKVVKKQGSKTYSVRVPEPNSNFDSYGVMATPPHGVCAVFARTKGFKTWAEAKAKRNSVAQLLSKYGKPHHVKPDMGDYTALSKRPPVDSFDFEWKDKLPAPIASIVLDVTSSGDELVVGLTYFYRNMSQCSNWQAQADLRGL